MSTTHRIRWKGRTEGPYTRDEIRRRLERGDLSMLHRVEVDGEWRPLAGWIDHEPARVEPSPAPRPPAGPQAHAPRAAARAPRPPAAVAEIARADSDFRVRLAYALSGLTFLFPLIATLPALVVSTGLRRYGRRADGDIQIALIAVFTALGLVFWHFVRQAFIAGRLG